MASSSLKSSASTAGLQSTLNVSFHHEIDDDAEELHGLNDLQSKAKHDASRISQGEVGKSELRRRVTAQPVGQAKLPSAVDLSHSGFDTTSTSPAHGSVGNTNSSVSNSGAPASPNGPSSAATSTPFSIAATNFPAPRTGSSSARSGKPAAKPLIAVTSFVSASSPVQTSKLGSNTVQALPVAAAVQRAKDVSSIRDMMRSHIAA